MKRAGTFALLVTAVICLTACASADHSWRGEFDARLEGATAAVEEDALAFGPAAIEGELWRTGIGLGQRLEFKRELIAGLSPPAGCETVQEEGGRKVGGLRGEGLRPLQEPDP